MNTLETRVNKIKKKIIIKNIKNTIKVHTKLHDNNYTQKMRSCTTTLLIVIIVLIALIKDGNKLLITTYTEKIKQFIHYPLTYVIWFSRLIE